jgi:hypothetical protein
MVDRGIIYNLDYNGKKLREITDNSTIDDNINNLEFITKLLHEIIDEDKTNYDTALKIFKIDTNDKEHDTKYFILLSIASYKLLILKIIKKNDPTYRDIIAYLEELEKKQERKKLFYDLIKKEISGIPLFRHLSEQFENNADAVIRFLRILKTETIEDNGEIKALNYDMLVDHLETEFGTTLEHEELVPGFHNVQLPSGINPDLLRTLVHPELLGSVEKNSAIAARQANENKEKVIKIANKLKTLKLLNDNLNQKLLEVVRSTAKALVAFGELQTAIASNDETAIQNAKQLVLDEETKTLNILTEFQAFEKKHVKS